MYHPQWPLLAALAAVAFLAHRAACFTPAASVGSRRQQQSACQRRWHGSRHQRQQPLGSSTKPNNEYESQQFVDIAGAREMSLEEQIRAMRREVAEQADEALADEDVVPIDGPMDITDDDVDDNAYPNPEGFVDESKTINWPGGRRVLQLGVLTVAAQGLFFFWIASLNKVSVNIPNISDALTDALHLGSGSGAY